MMTCIRLVGAFALLLTLVPPDSVTAQQHPNHNRGTRLVVPQHAGNVHANTTHANMAPSNTGQGNTAAVQQMRQQMQANHQAMMMQQQEILSSQMSRHSRIQKQHQIQAARLAHSSLASNSLKNGTSAAATTQTTSMSRGNQTTATATSPATTASASSTAATATSTSTTTTGSSAKSVLASSSPLAATVTPTTKTATAGSTTTGTGTSATTTNPAVASTTAPVSATGSAAATPAVVGTNTVHGGTKSGSRIGLAGIYATNFGQTSNVQGAQSVIMQLNNAYSSLTSADHDYQGHRVRAMNHIHNALRNLGMNQATLAAAGIQQNTATGTGAAGAGRLPQAQSDIALRQAIGYLRNAQMQTSNGGLGGSGAVGAMTSTGGTVGTMSTMSGRFGMQGMNRNVHGSISMAVRELEVALNIR